MSLDGGLCLPLNVTGHWGRVARPMQSEPSGPDTKTLWVGRGTRNTGVLGHATQTSKQCCNSMKNVSNSIAGALLSSSHVIVFGERLIMGVFGCKTSITISLRGFLLLVTRPTVGGEEDGDRCSYLSISCCVTTIRI